MFEIVDPDARSKRLLPMNELFQVRNFDSYPVVGESVNVEVSRLALRELNSCKVDFDHI
jgi:hypothetical protein